MKIRNSDKIVSQLVGHDMAQWFTIEARDAASGAPTFSLVYNTFRGGEIPLVVDMPLYIVKEELARFAQENTLMCFPYVRELVEEELGAEARFYPPLLNTGGWHWCQKCGGLVQGRVVLADGDYYLRPEAEDRRHYGYVVELCSCEEGKPEGVAVALARYFLSGDPREGRYMVHRDDGQMADGQPYEYYGQTVILHELGCFASYDEAQTAALARA